VDFARRRCEQADGMLFDIRRGTFSPLVVVQITQLLQSVQAKNAPVASAIHQQLTTIAWDEVGAHNMGALKRLIEASK
jgi:hypothetical protein